MAESLIEHVINTTSGDLILDAQAYLENWYEEMGFEVMVNLSKKVVDMTLIQEFFMCRWFTKEKLISPPLRRSTALRG